MKAVLVHIKRLWNLRFLILFIYLLKALLALLFMIPFFVTVNSHLSVSQIAQSLLTQWDITVLIELLKENTHAIVPLIMTGFIGAMIYIIIMQFFNGGLYYITISGNYAKIDWRNFFAECGANFANHLRITAMMIIVYVILIPAGLFIANIISGLGSFLIGIPVIITMLLKLAIILVMLLSASTFSDSARASIAACPDYGFKEILKTTADYFRPKLFYLLKIFLITYIPFVVIWLGSELASLQITAILAGMLGIIIEFLLFQISSLTRSTQKILYLTLLGINYRSEYPGRFIPKQIELRLDEK